MYNLMQNTKNIINKCDKLLESLSIEKYSSIFTSLEMNESRKRLRIIGSTMEKEKHILFVAGKKTESFEECALTSKIICEYLSQTRKIDSILSSSFEVELLIEELKKMSR